MMSAAWFVACLLLLLQVCVGFRLQIPRFNHARKDSCSKIFAIKAPQRFSSDDWWTCLLSLPHSKVLKRTRGNIVANTVWTAALVVLFKIRNIVYVYPATVHSMLGSVLGLLLVFRTNSAYDRFWEARKLWGNIAIANRNIARLVKLHISPVHYRRIANLTAAFVISLKQHLQSERDSSELAPFFDNESELQYTQQLVSRPTHVLHLLSQVINEGIMQRYSSPVQASMIALAFEEHFNSLCGAFAGCERIVKQPVPQSYSRHTSRFLSLYTFTLPLVLIATLGWRTVPTIACVCWSFASIEDIGHLIEEPFNKAGGILDLNKLVEANIRQAAESFFGIPPEGV